MEWALRLVVLAALGWMLWRETRPADVAGARRATAGELRARLGEWTGDPAVTSAHARLAGVPDDTVRDWLRALRLAGVEVGYAADSLTPVAVAAEPLADPAGAVRVTAAAPSSAALALADAVGVLDTVRAGVAGASLTVRSLAGEARATAGGTTARVPAPDSLLLRSVVVLGQAGWEGRFTVAALEERGWPVVVRLAVAPGVVVSQGTLATLDTARHAAVVALDTAAAAWAAQIARFVRQGGGLVLAPGAATVPALRALTPATPGASSDGSATLLASAEPRRGLPLRALALRADALALERRGDLVTIAAHRVGAGRVVQLGYDDTWRWRMAGPDGAPEAHRAWWAGVLRSAAYAPPAPPLTARPALDAAPVARLIATLGPPTPAPDVAPGATRRPTPWWLFPLIGAALLAEWVSRRTRGAR